jgi:hypothetical protein
VFVGHLFEGVLERDDEDAELVVAVFGEALAGLEEVLREELDAGHVALFFTLEPFLRVCSS